MLEPFGVSLDEDLVLEDDASRVLAGSLGIGFRADVKPHPVTVGLEGEGSARPRVHVTFARSLRRGGDPAAHAVDLLATSPEAFGVTRLAGASEWTEPPRRTERDLGGPLTVAVASAAGPRRAGPRAVVLAITIPGARVRGPLARRGAACSSKARSLWPRVWCSTSGAQP